MINYRKNVLSVVAALAISSTALYSTYVPLTTDGVYLPAAAPKDGVWTLFGVTAFNSPSGTTGGEDGQFSIGGGLSTSAIDRTNDSSFEDGFAQGNDYLGKVKMLDAGANTYIEVRVDTSDIVFEDTDPLRTIYVKDTDADGEVSATPIFALTYRASMEGKKLEYSRSILGTDAKTITINSENTFRYAAIGVPTTASDADNSDSLIAIKDAVDFNLSNNPYSSSFYDKDTYGDVQAGNDRFRMYRFDAQNQQWEIYDMNNTVNDFSNLEVGRGYWGRMQLDSSSVGGIVLGKATQQIPHATYTDLEADAWNLLAFDDFYPDIRNSSTGLRLDVNASTNLTLIDSSTGYEIVVAIGGTDVVADSQLINAAVANAKDSGSIARVFDLKAFPTGAGATQEITLISNKRFGVKDSTASGGITSVTTLLGNKPFDPVTLENEAFDVIELGDVNSSDGVYSKYGEYTVIIKPLVGSGTAADENVSSISLVSGTATEVIKILDLNSTIDTVAKVGTNLDLLDGYKAFGIDLKYESNSSDLDPGYVLIASDNPFYITDKTYIRAFTVRDDANIVGDGDVDFQFTIFGSGESAGGTNCTDTVVSDTAAVTIDERNVSDAINSTCLSTAGRSATDRTDSSQGYLIIAGNKDRYLDVQEKNSTSRLQDATAPYVDKDGNTIDAYDYGIDFAKGAVSELYIISKLASLDTMQKFVIDIDTYNNDLNDSISFELNTTGTYSNVGYEEYNITNQQFTEADTSTYFDLIEQKLGNLFAEHNITYSIEHNGTSGDINGSVMTILTDNNVDGIRIATVELAGGSFEDANLSDANATKTSGVIDVVNAEETLNLKTNAYKSPDYVIDGPLYTMREAGFQLRALVTGAMNYQTDTMAWDNVDLTREPSKWFDDAGDYNLFGIDSTSGYWAYLTDPDSDESDFGIDGTKVSVNTQKYHSHWDPRTGVATNHLVANFTVSLKDTLGSWDANNSITAVASIGGAEIDLRNSSNGGLTFVSGVNTYDNPGLLGDRQSILLKLSDGLGIKTDGNIDTGLVLDLEKPAKPVISLETGAPKITTTYTENVTYHVIGNTVTNGIDEGNWGPADALLGASAVAGDGLTKSEFESYKFCKDGAADPVTYKVFVVDGGSDDNGTGKLGMGNASDFDEFTYAALLYDAARIQSIYNTGIETVSLGDEYNTSCELINEDVSFGLQLTAMTEGATVTLASSAKYISDNAGQPLTIYVSNNGIIVRLDYQIPYATTEMYFEIAGEVWSYTLPTEANLDLLNNTYDNPLDISVDRAAAPAHTAKQFIGLTL